MNPEDQTKKPLSLRWGGSDRPVTRRAKRADADAAVPEWLPKMVRERAQDSAVSGRAQHTAESVKPTNSRLRGLIGAVFFALVWNGMVLAVGRQALMGTVSWPLALFMIPFVVVGLVVIGVVVHQFLALSNPVFELTFEPRVVAPGQTLRLGWAVNGKSGRIRRLTVAVEADESATYTRGTDTITETHRFFEHTLYETDANPLNPIPRQHELELQIPADTMHSVDAPRNKILWRVKVHADIPRWPDVKDEYEFAVVPPGLAPESRGMF